MDERCCFEAVLACALLRDGVGRYFADIFFEMAKLILLMFEKAPGCVCVGRLTCDFSD